MPIKTVISGETLEEYLKAVTEYVAMVAPGVAVDLANKQVSQQHQPHINTPEPASNVEAIPGPNPSLTTTPAPSQRGKRPTTAPKTIEGKAVTADDVSKALRNVIQAVHGSGAPTSKARDYLQEFMSRFGVTKVSDVPPENWADFVEAAEKAIVGAANLGAAQEETTSA